MRQIVLLILTMAAAIAGCSSAPKVAAPPPPAAVARPTAATAPVAAASQTVGGSAGAAPANAPSKEAISKKLVSRGYKVQTYRGQLVYCRSEKVTGSQFSQRTCLTEAQAVFQEQTAQDDVARRTLQGQCMPSGGTSGACIHQ